MMIYLFVLLLAITIVVASINENLNRLHQRFGLLLFCFLSVRLLKAIRIVDRKKISLISRHSNSATILLEPALAGPGLNLALDHV